jgi:hypothetical protein
MRFGGRIGAGDTGEPPAAPHAPALGPETEHEDLDRAFVDHLREDLAELDLGRRVTQLDDQPLDELRLGQAGRRAAGREPRRQTASRRSRAAAELRCATTE